jgi:hypothetical protein
MILEMGVGSQKFPQALGYTFCVSPCHASLPGMALLVCVHQIGDRPESHDNILGVKGIGRLDFALPVFELFISGP